MDVNPYELLEIERDSTEQDIKKAYRRKASKAHPDKGGSDQLMIDVREAYDLLMDPERRRTFDETGSFTRRSDLEQVARNILAELFKKFVIEGDDHTDPIPYLQRNWDETLAHHRGHREKLEQQIAQVKRRQSQIKRKEGGEDLYAILIEGQLRILRGLLDKVSNVLLVDEMLHRMITEYDGKPFKVSQWEESRPMTAYLKWREL